jgi:hypothetical protein
VAEIAQRAKVATKVATKVVQKVNTSKAAAPKAAAPKLVVAPKVVAPNVVEQPKVVPAPKAVAAPKAAAKIARAGKAETKPEHKFEDELMAVAEQLIVKGKEQGYLTPDDILQGFPEVDAEPDQIFRIFAAF